MKNDMKNGKKTKQKGEKNIIVTIVEIVSVLVIVAIQIGVYLALYATTKEIYNNANTVLWVIKAISVLYILYRHDNAAYKISWIVFIMFFPVAGIIIYLLWGNSRLRLSKVRTLSKINDETKSLLEKDDEIEEEIKKINRYRYNQVRYMTTISGYPVYRNEHVEYFDVGEKFFDSLKKDLAKAQKYILVEFFIIAKGKLLNEIIDILKLKAESGVKVQIIYDSLGSILKTPKNFDQDLMDSGIEVYKFNPFTAYINTYVNYRDHRKIVVIDGSVAYTGGVNIADEYINIITKYGHWKDNGIKICGEAVTSYLTMFIRTLESIKKQSIDYDWYVKNKNKEILNLNTKKVSRGYVVNYADGPNNRKNPSENIYVQMINYAKDYIYITTPYLAISEVVLISLLNSARSGVDVRIIVPYIPDKKIVNIVTKSYYEVLLEAGVKIYEYTPGFMHAKTFLSDDEVAIVGTANLDFRSLHINYECGTWTYNTGVEKQIKEDIEDTLKQSKKIELDEWKKRNIFIRFSEALFSAFGPMF